MSLSTEDVLEIQRLAARYCHTLDGGDADGFCDTFVESGVFDAGDLVVEGHDAMRNFVEKFAQTMHAPRHIATNLLIDGDGDHATMKSYLQMFYLAGDPAHQTQGAAGQYDDTMTKENGAWKFVHRKFTMDT